MNDTATRMTAGAMGRIDPARIRRADIPRPASAVLEPLRAIRGVTELVSDALDDLGIDGVVSASDLRPTLPGSCVVGPAITLRNEPLHRDPFEVAGSGHLNRQADFEAHNLTRPGDVLVIRGAPGVSNIGGISATMAKRQGGLAAVVDGGIRDVARSREIGYPIWCRDVTAKTGRWRQETAEINGDIEIFGIRVRPGDIICADDSAVCVIPAEVLGEVIAAVLRRDRTDDEYIAFLDGNRPLEEFPRPDPARFRE